MKPRWVGMALCLVGVAAQAQAPPGEALLDKIDANQTSRTKVTVWR